MVRGLVVDLLQHQDVLVPGFPVALQVLLGHDAAFQEHVLDPLDPGNIHALADLAGRLLAVELRLVQGLVALMSTRCRLYPSTVALETLWPTV